VLTRANRAGGLGPTGVTVARPFADAVEITIPVRLPVTLQSDATWGELRGDSTVVLPIQAPAVADRSLGELRLTTSTTLLSTLGDAMEYLTAYPFECAEQVASRILGLSALRELGAGLDSPGLPHRDEFDPRMRRDLARLQTLQTRDGGFAFWGSSGHAWPIVSIHAAHALARAQASGVPIDWATRARVVGYLRLIESHVADYDRDSRLTLWAYALDVRRLLGDADPAAARRLLAQASDRELGIETSAWLLSVFAGDSTATAEVARLRRVLEARAVETAGTAHFALGYREEERSVLLASNPRADAVVLEALIRAVPESGLIPKLASGLLAQRTAGRWATTQGNAFALLALARYFKRIEAGGSGIVARAWFDGGFVGEQSGSGRTTDRCQADIPLTRLGPAGSMHELLLSKSGSGFLYYRVGLRYAPEAVAPEQRGFTVERSYEAVDHPGDVQRGADGKWRLKVGARVRVRLALVAPSRRHHVALSDPLPAGLEPLNPELATTGPMPSDRDVRRRTFWLDYEEFHDDRAVASAALLPDGVWTYSYLARATTRGIFTVPPPQVEEMYSPETFGRGSTDRVEVQ
jgi:alpha-2-macroglobulin